VAFADCVGELHSAKPLAKGAQTGSVAGNGIILEIPSYYRFKPFSGFHNRFVHPLTKLLFQGMQHRPHNALRSCRRALFSIFGVSFLRVLHQHQWVVYTKPPFSGANHVLNYLARYTHRVAISNHRLVALPDGKVTFRWKDYAHGKQQKLMTVSVEEFLRCFLLHTLPRGFVRIRFFGYMANRRRTALLPICRELIGTNSESVPKSKAVQKVKYYHRILQAMSKPQP
jgi:hypothetical protein